MTVAMLKNVYVHKLGEMALSLIFYGRFDSTFFGVVLGKLHEDLSKNALCVLDYTCGKSTIAGWWWRCCCGFSVSFVVLSACRSWTWTCDNWKQHCIQ